MALTTAQQSALQAAITADAALTTLNTANGFQQIADAMNLASSTCCLAVDAEHPD